MIKIVLSLLIAVSLNASALDVVQDYLVRNTFPIRNSPYDGQLFQGVSWDGDSHGEPSGGYLLRFEAPLGPKGERITFIASSLLAYERGSNWYAYRATDHGPVLLNDLVSFSDMNFYLASPSSDHGPVLCEVYPGKTSYGVGGVSLDKSGKLIQVVLIGMPRDQDREEADPAFAEAVGNTLNMKNHLVPFTPKIEKILLMEYLKDPKTPWRLSGRDDMAGEMPTPAEKKRIAATVNFTREEAAKLWKAQQHASSSSSNK